MCRHRPAPSRALALAGFLQLLLATPALAIDSVVHGAVVDTSIGTSAVGDSLMGELGGEWAGLRSDGPGRWLLQWDLLLAARGGYLADQVPALSLAGGHGLAEIEIGYRTAAASLWSLYVGARLGGDLLVMPHPGLSLSALNTVSSVDGVGGIVAEGIVGLDVGFSLLDSIHSLRLVALAQESLHAPETNTPGYAFTEIGVGVRFDVTRSIATSLEAVVGAAPVRRNEALGLTDKTFHGLVELKFRKLFGNGMWLGAAALLERYTDRITYTHGASYSTSDAPTIGILLSYGLPFWRDNP